MTKTQSSTDSKKGPVDTAHDKKQTESDAALFRDDPIDEILARLKGYVKGQFLVCFALAVYYALALSILGLKTGWIVGIIAGFLAIIPVFGAIIALVLTMLAVIIESINFDGLSALSDTDFAGLSMFEFLPTFHPLEPGLFFWALVIFIVAQLLESFIFAPYFMGRKTGLSPLTIFLALMVGGLFFGIIGMIMAVPIAIIMVVYRRHHKRKHQADALHNNKDGDDSAS